MLMNHLADAPFWGLVALVGVTGAITLACFATMFWMLLRPGETNPDHAKYDILRPDR